MTRLSARRPAQRLTSDWGRHTATPNALKTGHSKQTFTEFNVLPTQYDTEKKDRRLRQGQTTRLSARCPAQRLARHWGRHTAAPNALETGHCKQTVTDFNVLSTQYDTKKRIGASAKARRRAFRRATRPNVRRQGKRVNPFGKQRFSPFTVEGPRAPPPCSVPRALTGAQRSSSHAGALLDSITLQQHKHWWRDSPAHLCGYATRMWIPPIRR